MKTVVIASNNAHKAQEIAEALDFPGWDFMTLKQKGISSDPAEDADSFLGNARIKALAAHAASGGLAVLADDSGLEVDALDGAPGVYSARYARCDAADQENNTHLLKALEGVQADERTARFVCVLVYIDEEGNEVVAQGFIEGAIGLSEQGEGGFGYDPLFYPDAFEGKKSFAQVSSEEKNALSHRGNALRELREKLVGGCPL